MNEITNLAPPNLHAVYVWGIEVIRAVQMLLPSSLDLVIRILSDALVYGFALVPLTYMWCADYKKGLHLFYLFVFITPAATSCILSSVSAVVVIPSKSGNEIKNFPLSNCFTTAI